MGLYDKVFQSKTKPIEERQEQEPIQSAIQPSKLFDEPVAPEMKPKTEPEFTMVDITEDFNESKGIFARKEPEIKPEDEQDLATLQAMDSVFTEKLNAGEFKTNADIPTHQERNEAYYQYRRARPDGYTSFRDWMAMEQDPLAEAFTEVVSPSKAKIGQVVEPIASVIKEVDKAVKNYRDGLPPGLREAQDRYQASRKPQDIDVPQSINKTDILPLGTWVITDGKEDGWQVVDYDVLQDQYKLDKGGMWETIDGNRVSVDPKYTTGIEDTGQPDLFEMSKEEVDQAMVAIAESAQDNIDNGTFEQAYGYPNPAEEIEITPALINKAFDKALWGEKQPMWIGVDPGKKGGIVAISNQGIVGKWVIPLIGDNVDAEGIWIILNGLKEKHNPTLILEDVHSLFGMSASTNFSMGHTLGILDGIIAVSKIKLSRVAPKTWQKEIWENNDMEYKPIKPEQKKASVDTKLTSMKAAHRLYPNADFRATTRSKNDWDGITDAVCLAEYGRRKNL